MPLLRAFSTLGCPEFNLDQALALAAKYGLAAIELRALGGTVDLPAYFKQQFGTPQALAEQMRGSPVRVVSLDTSLHLMAGKPNEREQLIEFVPWAEALGVPYLRGFDGGKTGDAAELAEGAETIRWWRELRRSKGWRTDLMVETHDVLFTAALIKEFLKVAPGTAILWDTHHTWKRGGEDPLTTWRAIHSHVVQVHVKDSMSVPSAKHPYTYVLPGLGEFPEGPLLAELRATGFVGPVSLEWELLWHPYLPSLDEALGVAAERKWW